MKKMLSYLQLNSDQRLCADKIPALLGVSLEDEIFAVIDDVNISALVTRIQENMVYCDWGTFCFTHRKTIKRGEACCTDGYSSRVKTEEVATYLLSLKSLKEKYDEMMENL